MNCLKCNTENTGKFCTNCGEVLGCLECGAEVIGRFCTSCGCDALKKKSIKKEVGTEIEAKKPKGKSKAGKVILAILGIIIFLIIIAPKDDSTDTSSNSSNTSNNVEVATNNQPNNEPVVEDTEDTAMPKVEKDFIALIKKYMEQFDGAANELQQSALRNNRKIEISKLMKSKTIKSWTGTINNMTTTTEGKAHVSIQIAPEIEIMNMNNSFSDLNTNSLIDMNSQIYKDLINMAQGQKVIFSCQLLPDERDYIQEMSLTIAGSMQEPTFICKFDSIKPLN